MCCSSSREASEPSEIPSSTSTVWVRIGDIASGLPAIAAMPTAIMAPEISPPGRCAHKNSAPPVVPITRVSSTLRVLARLGTAEAIDARIWLTRALWQIPARGTNAPTQLQQCRLRFDEAGWNRIDSSLPSRPGCRVQEHRLRGHRKPVPPAQALSRPLAGGRKLKLE